MSGRRGLLWGCLIGAKPKALPVIMLTGNSSDEDLLKGYMYGADYYIIKPFRIQTILNGIALVFKPDPNQSQRYTI